MKPKCPSPDQRMPELNDPAEVDFPPTSGRGWVELTLRRPSNNLSLVHSNHSPSPFSFVHEPFVIHTVRAVKTTGVRSLSSQREPATPNGQPRAVTCTGQFLELACPTLMLLCVVASAWRRDPNFPLSRIPHSIPSFLLLRTPFQFTWYLYIFPQAPIRELRSSSFLFDKL